MRVRLRAERGWAMVTAIILMTIMMGTVLAAFAFVDAQQRESGVERTRESSFNLAEGALTLQTFVLGRDWPGTVLAAYPTSCPSALLPAKCPDSNQIVASYASQDFASGSSWTTTVRDNGGAAYDDTQPSWDANLDGKVWARSQALVRGRRRTLLALVGQEYAPEPFPRKVLLAGSFKSKTGANKILVERKTSGLALRCANASDLTCVDYKPGQISPEGGIELGYQGSAFSVEALNRLRATAKSLNTYSTTCPASMTGAVVFVEPVTDVITCSYSSSQTFNSVSQPGMFVMTRGQLRMSGNTTFYGFVYHANAGGVTATVVDLDGNSLLQGGVLAEGLGAKVEVGSAAVNLSYDDRLEVRLLTGARNLRWREIQG